MDNILILDKLYNGLKFKDATYSEQTNVCTVNFLYNPENFKPSEEIKQEILKKLKDIIGNYVDYLLSFVSCPLDKRTIANHAYLTIKNNFPAINKNFTYDDVSVNIENMKVSITLRLVPSAYNYAKGQNREGLIADKLKESFLADFHVAFVEKEDEIVAINAIASNMELMASIKEAEEKTVFELSEMANIIGKNDYSLAIDFKMVNSPIENVAICGEVTTSQIKTYKRKVKYKGEEKEIEKRFCNFAIKNDGKVLYCSIFPKQSDEVKLDLIETGIKICCLGSFREFNGKLNFTANSIARCEYKKEEIKSQLKQVNEEYHTIFPQEYVDYEQTGLFDEEVIPFNGTYVVFDLETTGLDGNKDDIIEIGACKIINGKITETFSTLVNPNKHIPKDATDTNHITDDMVKDAPTINYVMPDFYKFCYGSTLVGQNVAFDISFIHTISKKLSYQFDHELMDTLPMAKELLPGLKNYKLGTIAEKLGVSLENAHRALDDTVATAKIFIKLMQKKLNLNKN